MENKQSKDKHKAILFIVVIVFLFRILHIIGCFAKEENNNNLKFEPVVYSVVDSFGISYELISSIDKEMSSKIQLTAFSIMKGGLSLNSSVITTIELREKYNKNIQAVIVANHLRDALTSKDFNCCPEILNKVNTDSNWSRAWEEMAISLNESDPIRKNIEIIKLLADEISKGTSPKLALDIVLNRKSDK
ncbi:MAG: hypothetical protein IPM42_16180 [Saprospiraceae bacterium]|nr:hypothetical protein [Saprospiraceae bacterium]